MDIRSILLSFAVDALVIVVDKAKDGNANENGSAVSFFYPFSVCTGHQDARLSGCLSPALGTLETSSFPI